MCQHLLLPHGPATNFTTRDPALTFGMTGSRCNVANADSRSQGPPLSPLYGTTAEEGKTSSAAPTWVIGLVPTKTEFQCPVNGNQRIADCRIKRPRSDPASNGKRI